MNWYITFSGDNYHETTKRIVEDAHRLGADRLLVYDDAWLMGQEFYQVNKKFWDHPHKRGFGWYIWKPFLILATFDRMEHGDVVLFTDADTYPIAPLKIFYDTCRAERGIMLFAVREQTHEKWCKRDAFVVMAQDKPEYRNVTAGVARFFLFQKGPWLPRQFLYEWLTYMINPLANTFDPSIIHPEHPWFVEHRCDQAIMTNLANKYGIPLHREANGCEVDLKLYPNDLYPESFVQHNPLWGQTPKKLGSAFRNV